MYHAFLIHHTEKTTLSIICWLECLPGPNHEQGKSQTNANGERTCETSEMDSLKRKQKGKENQEKKKKIEAGGLFYTTLKSKCSSWTLVGFCRGKHFKDLIGTIGTIWMWPVC